MIKYLILSVFLFSCTHVKTVSKQSRAEVKVFDFLLDDLKGVDIRDKFMCLSPRFVNIKLRPRINFKQQYPNPCCPPSFPPYVIHLDKSDILDISLITNDSIYTAVRTRIFNEGYYVFRTQTFLLNEMDKKNFRIELSKHRMEYSIMILINGKKFLYKLGHY